MFFFFSFRLATNNKEETLKRDSNNLNRHLFEKFRYLNVSLVKINTTALQEIFQLNIFYETKIFRNL